MSTQSSVHTDSASTLSFRVLEPVPATPRSLLVLLHGVRGNETNLLDLAADAPADTLVVFARGRLTLAPDQYAWFRVALTESGPKIAPEEAEESRLALIQLIARLQTRFLVPPARTIVAGFSQGGIMSASVALSSPELMTGFAVLGGRILPELEPAIAPRDALSTLRALIAHGRDDGVLPADWAARSHDLLDRLGVAHELKFFECGHVVDAGMKGAFSAWLAEHLPGIRHDEAPDLQLDNEVTSVTVPGDAPLRIAPGIDEVVAQHLAKHAAMGYAMESAIAAIEDELAKAPRTLHHQKLVSRSNALMIEIARACGLVSAGELHRDAVEQLFERQTAVAEGRRPAVSEGLPAEPAFVAALLLVRELMHHLDVESIAIEP